MTWPRLKIAVVIVGMLAGCSTSGGAKPSGTARQQLDAVAVQCHLPPSIFTLRGKGDLYFRPSPDAKYEDVDCALSGLKRLPFDFNLGFIGNEQYREEGNSQ